MNEEIETRDTGIPGKIPANRQDWANHLGYLWNANRQIQIIAELNGQLDINCLRNAVRLSINVAPVLGCSFIEDEHTPYWGMLKKLDEIEWCTLYETNERAEAIKRILASPLDPEERQLQIAVIRSQGGDTLCIKLNHACCDGGGAKYYLHLLSEIYNCLFEGKCYTWKADTAGIRDSGSVFKALGITDPKTAFNPQLAVLKPTWAFPYKEAGVSNFAFSVCRIERSEAQEIHSYARSKGLTMNDLILTAFYRAMFCMISPEYGVPMEICVTVDLRRYLKDKRENTICNLSGVENHRLVGREGESFTSTLERVALAMAKIKSNHPGIHSAASIELMAEMGYKNAASFVKNAWEESVRSGKSTINLSNMGAVSSYQIKFGKGVVEDAFIVTPAFKSPSFMLGTSSYDDVLTFTVGYCEPEVKKDNVETFLNLLKDQLISCIK